MEITLVRFHECKVTSLILARKEYKVNSYIDLVRITRILGTNVNLIIQGNILLL